MKVAIIGAGLAGLSCAIELEKHGIIPTIFERNSFIGDSEDHVGAVLEIVNRPITQPLKYLKDKHGISITPVSSVNVLSHYGPHSQAIIKGNFGHFLKRNRDHDSLKAQLYSHLRKPHVIFSEFADPQILAGRYDYVVVATGNPIFTKEFGCWQNWTSGHIRVAVVLGKFNPHELVMYINKDYSKNGYAYLTPYNEHKASIALFVPDTEKQDLHYYWDLFLYSENIKYTIVEESIIKHDSGYVYPHLYKNIFFVGSAGGMIDPFLGFGQVSSMLSGIYAAQAMVKGKNIDRLLNSILKRSIYPMRDFRKSFNNLTNKGYDNLISLIGVPGIKNLIYYTDLNALKVGSFTMKSVRKMNEDRPKLK